MGIDGMTHEPAMKRVYAWFSAISNEDIPQLNDLLADGVPVDVPHPLRHSTALMEATRLGRTTLAHWLLDHGAAPAFLSGMPLGTPLHCALRLRRWELAQLLIDRMPTVAIADAYGCTPLHIICRDALPAYALDQARRATVAILAKSCPLEALDKDGATALHHCIINDLRETAELLLAHGANPNALIPDTAVSPLAIAALEKNLPMATLLLRHGADPYLKIHDGSSPASIHPVIARLADQVPSDGH